MKTTLIKASNEYSTYAMSYVVFWNTTFYIIKVVMLFCELCENMTFKVISCKS